MLRGIIALCYNLNIIDMKYMFTFVTSHEISKNNFNFEIHERKELLFFVI